MIGCVVVSLTGAWALTEALQLKNSLDSPPREAPLFYGLYMLMLLMAYLMAISGVNIVTLNVIVQTMNTMLLPVVLVFLVAVARRLPRGQALGGWALWAYVGIFSVIALIGVVTGFIGLVTL
jgi:Mn2+/Fe2+ NRAMP family transporter